MVELTADATNGFSVESFGIFTAPYGTAIPETTGGDLTGFTYLGAASKDTGFTLSLPGEPTRNVVQAFIDGGLDFFVTYTASTDPAQISFGALETTQAALEAIFGGVFDGQKMHFPGGVPDSLVVVAVLQAANGDEIWVGLDNAKPVPNGDITTSGDNTGLVWPGSFNGDRDPVTKDKFVIVLPSDES